MQALKEALTFLPERLRRPLSELSGRLEIWEICLRKDLPLSVTCERGNVFVGAFGAAAGAGDALRTRREEIAQVLERLCEHSVYRHAEQLSRGYLISPHGVRAGLCGQMLFDPDTRTWKPDLTGVSGVDLRIPREIPGAADPLLEYFSAHTPVSTLVYSPPGAGKTTLLRDLAQGLSRGAFSIPPLRVAVLDERNELFPEKSGGFERAGLLDLIGGLPKALAIERAVRLIDPQVIVCDELGLQEDARALVSVSQTGVIFLASAHAADRDAVFRLPVLRELLEQGAFSLLCGLSCAGGVRTLKIERAS